jgi:hypothetical protein
MGRSHAIAPLSVDGQVNCAMRRPIPRFPGLPFGGGLNLLLVAGAAYFAWEHEQGRHEQSHALCPICWLNKIAPAEQAPGDASAAEPPDQA